MTKLQAFIARRFCPTTAAAALLFYAAAAIAQAQTTPPTDTVPVGRIDFARVNLPPANVELDLSQGMFRDLFGIGDAAAAGIAESLLKAADANRAAEGTRLAAEKLAAAREILQLARDVVREVRVRVYENKGAEAAEIASFERLASQFDDQLQNAKWETVVRVRQEKENARVALLRYEGAIRGAFIIAGDGRSLVLANIVADISPANVKKLTSAAATIGLENGLQQAIEMQMRQLQRRTQGPDTKLAPLTPPSVTAPRPADPAK